MTKNHCEDENVEIVGCGSVPGSQEVYFPCLFGIQHYWRCARLWNEHGYVDPCRKAPGRIFVDQASQVWQKLISSPWDRSVQWLAPQKLMMSNLWLAATGYIQRGSNWYLLILFSKQTKSSVHYSAILDPEKSKLNYENGDRNLFHVWVSSHFILAYKTGDFHIPNGLPVDMSATLPLGIIFIDYLIFDIFVVVFVVSCKTCKYVP